MPQHFPDDGPLTNKSSYLSGTACACGTVSTQVPVPAGASFAMIHAEGGKGYWNTNGTVAGTASPGYVAADQTGLIPPVDNLSALYVYGEAATIMHVEFYQD
jgi:hypothetical protein